MAINVKTPEQPIEAAPETTTDLKIEYRPLDALVEYSKNPRKNDKAVPDMIALIERFGFRQPILVNGSQVVDGHLRVKAARKMGMTSLPVIDVAGMPEADIRALRIAMNKSVEWADWDNALLADEFKALEEAGVELKFTGFEQGLIDKIMAEAFGPQPKVNKTGSADAGDPADPNYVALTFHVPAKDREMIKDRLETIKVQHGLTNRSAALIHLCSEG